MSEGDLQNNLQGHVAMLLYCLVLTYGAVFEDIIDSSRYDPWIVLTSHHGVRLSGASLTVRKYRSCREGNYCQYVGRSYQSQFQQIVCNRL